MNNKVEKWKGWLDVIGKQIQNMLVKQDTHNTILNIIAKNRLLHQHNLFYDHLFHTYIAYISVALRRQLKKHNNSISLYGLLDDMSKNTDLIPAHNLLSVNPNDDIKSIKEMSLSIENYVDKRIAHTDKGELKQLPSPKEIDDCIMLMKNIHKKYNSVVNDIDIELMPALYDWTEIFKEPWIQKNKSNN